MAWEYIDGYDNTGGYTDSKVFEIDFTTKKMALLEEQIMVSGEDNSQFIRFICPQYYDGIDLSTKNIQIIYMTESGYSDINAAIMVEKDTEEEKLRFGWLVPQAASYDVGTLSFGIEFVGNDYVLKTIANDVEVFDGLNGGEIIPEPGEQVWYIELQSRCDYVLDQATAAKDAADASAASAATSEENAAASEAAAQLSQEAAATSEQNAATSETNAQTYAEQAAAVFQVAGDVSFVIGSDNGVTMIFTEGE